MKLLAILHILLNISTLNAAESETLKDFPHSPLVSSEQPTSEEFDVQTYPNPFINELNITSENADIQRVEVWSIKKRIMFLSPIEIPRGAKITINTSTYPQGHYVVKVFFENLTKTLIVSK